MLGLPCRWTLSRLHSTTMASRILSVTDLKQFSCAVCMDVFQSPTRIACGHVFCEECLNGLQAANGQQTCPECRNPFQTFECTPANDIEILMQTSSGLCKFCSTEIECTALRDHMNSCGEATAASQELIFKPICPTAQGIPKEVPNRMTFQCPYCVQANLDCKAMVEHCNQKHQHDRSSVVCPICAAMPWGDPNLCSSNFIAHLNTRHKFEYDTFVDFHQQDDDMLNAAILASLQES